MSRMRGPVPHFSQEFEILRRILAYVPLGNEDLQKVREVRMVPGEPTRASDGRGRDTKNNSQLTLNGVERLYQRRKGRERANSLSSASSCALSSFARPRRAKSDFER